MSYDGFEVDMLNLGDADSILATRWIGGLPTRILIDGGNISDSEKVLAFLATRGVKYLDHIVCSHPHDDHAGGLIGVVKSQNVDFGQAWVHLPWNHVDLRALATSLSRSTASRVIRIIRASFETQKELVTAIANRSKNISEPFAGQVVGFLTVCGPPREYYEELLKDFTDLEKLKTMEEALAAHEQQRLLEEVLQNTLFGKALLESKQDELGGAPTEPENDSSTILATKYDGNTVLLTADAGVDGLTHAKNAYQIANLRWMQIPHHGSRRNISKELIQHFKPRTAFVSADGNKKHPRRAVVNAFKEEGAMVFSTHYPNGSNLWFHLGNVPSRPDYSSATPLYDAGKEQQE